MEEWQSLKDTTNIFESARPQRRTEQNKRTLANEAWSASECFRALLAGGGCISSSLGELVEYGEEVARDSCGTDEDAAWLGAGGSTSAMSTSASCVPSDKRAPCEEGGGEALSTAPVSMSAEG